MNDIEMRIDAYLNAVEKKRGRAERLRMVVEPRGGSQVFVKESEEDYGQLVDVGRLDSMTEYLLKH